MNYCRYIVATEIWKIIFMMLIYHCSISTCSVPCDYLYGGCKQHLEHFLAPVFAIKNYEPPRYMQQSFLPSPPGKIPRCAKPGLTFCEKIDRYPTNLIRTLAEKISYSDVGNFRHLIKTLAAKTTYNFRTLFADESGGQRMDPQIYSNRFNPDIHLSPPNVDIGFNDFNQSSQHEGYPERRYPLEESSVHLVDPVLYASFAESNPFHPSEWWKRSERSNGKTGNKRKRRQTAAPSGTELCPTRSQFIMPRAALNNRGEWRYVVNVDEGSEKYTQLVKSETCLTNECNGICSLPNGYTSRCEQKYVQKRLVALEGTGSQLYTDIFWFPHCCVCQIAPDIR